jgi:hypothetical protein
MGHFNMATCLGTGGDGLRNVTFYFQGLSGLTGRVCARIWLDSTRPAITIISPGSGTLFLTRIFHAPHEMPTFWSADLQSALRSR